MASGTVQRTAILTLNLHWEPVMATVVLCCGLSPTDGSTCAQPIRVVGLHDLAQ